jgi:DNA-binding GntR family transcriptional regulator
VKIHREITQIAENAVLTKMLRDIDKRASWYRAPFEPSGLRRAWEEHEVIVGAILDGDVDAAMSAISLHVDKVRERLYEAIRPTNSTSRPSSVRSAWPS